MLAAYVDETGHPRSGTYLILGGLAATGEQWEALELAWSRAKADYDFPIGPDGNYVPFHATDFFSGRQAFKHYDIGPSTKAELYDRLLRIMCQHVGATAYTILLYDAWEAFIRDDAAKKKLVYTMCALGLTSRLWRWARARGEPLAYVFENAKKVGQGKAFDAMKKVGKYGFSVGSITTSIKGLPALDAADIWCYELRHYLNDILSTNDPTPRGTMKKLLRIHQQCGYVLGKYELAAMLQYMVDNSGKQVVHEIPLQALSIPFVSEPLKASDLIL